MLNNYGIRYTQHSQNDVISMRQYILKEFEYLELVDNFDKKMSKAIKKIQNAPKIYQPTEFYYREYEIYMRCVGSYLFFYIVEDVTIILLRVLQNGMNWKYIIKSWIEKND